MNIHGLSLTEVERVTLLKQASDLSQSTIWVHGLNSALHFAKSIVGFNAHHVFWVDSIQHEPASLALLPWSDIAKASLEDHAGILTLSFTLNKDHTKQATSALQGPLRFFAAFHEAPAANAFLAEFNRMLDVQIELQHQAERPNGLTQQSPTGVLEQTLQAPRQHESAIGIESPLDVDFEEEKPVSSKALFRLWQFAKPYQGRLFLGFVLTLLSTAATLVAPYLTMPLMDDVLIPYQNGQGMNTQLAGLYLLALLGSALAAAVFAWARTYLLALVSERIGSDLRTTTFRHLMGLSLDYFSAKRTGDLISRVSSETDRINLFLSLHALDFLTDVVMMVMTAAILMSIDAKLALLTLVPLPLIAWLIHLVRERLRTGFEKVDRVWGEVSNILADTIPGIRVVKAFAQEERESQRFWQANVRNLEVNDRINKTWSLFAPIVGLLTELGILVIWVAGIWMIMHDSITVGVLTAFLAYISRFYARLDSMSRIVSVTQKAAAGAKRIFDILDYQSSVPPAANPIHIQPGQSGQLRGALKLQNVAFRYGSRQVLRNVNIDIKPGEMIGLVGHSGSGKSTLVNLLCRFYDVTEGAIFVDGYDIRQLDMKGYRQHIGLVLQEPFLFFGTIAENIAYGKPNASRAEIIQAARLAHAHEFILRLPHGYDSYVGERGQSLSGGERQRISIARALLINPSILILDEATSSVDSQTEKEIQKALDNLVRGRTTIAIAHRLSTLRKAHRIVVMDRGQVVEEGTHQALLEAKGFFWNLHQAQEKLKQAEVFDE